VVLFAAPSCGAAWWKTGHHVVANIAYDRLPVAARQKVIALLRTHPCLARDFEIPDDVRSLGKDAEDRWIFLIASEWPDIIRGQAKYDRPKWHYINNPVYLTDTDREVLSKVLKRNPGQNLLPALKDEQEPLDLNASQAVKLCLQRLGKNSISAERKAVYVCWLSHIVGDLHQPCHSASLYSRALFHEKDGDRGGNRVLTTQNGNLHAFWDGLLGSAKLSSVGDMNAVRKRAQQILATDHLRLAAEKALEIPDIDRVISESYLLVRDVVYDKNVRDHIMKSESAGAKLAPLNLPLEYRQAAGELARRRVAEAGYRLAVLLENAVK